MKYDKCVDDKEGGGGKGEHSRGQDGVLVSGQLDTVHPTIEYGGARRHEQHTAGDREEYIDALVHLGAQQMACNCNGMECTFVPVIVVRYYLCSVHCI